MQNYISGLCSLGLYKDFKIADLYDLTKQLNMTILFDVRSIWESAADLKVIQSPGLEKNFDEITLKTRKFDIQYSYLSAKKLITHFILPEEFTVKFLPEKILIDNEYIYYSAEYIFNKEIGKIDFSEKMVIKKRKIPADKYDFYKSELLKIVKFSKQRIFLEKK